MTWIVALAVVFLQMSPPATGTRETDALPVHTSVPTEPGGNLSISDALLPEFDQQMAATRLVIERVPVDDPGEEGA